MLSAPQIWQMVGNGMNQKVRDILDELRRELKSLYGQRLERMLLFTQ